MKFKNIYQKAQEQAKLALLSLWTPGDHPMRQYVTDLLNSEPLMAEPVFQNMFPWTTAPTSDKWAEAFDPDVLSELAIGQNHPPYSHQAESWRELAAGQSLVVTSGTGSGKTECFMYPVLNDLYRHKANGGIQALFLYPLNALMEDQRKRLDNLCQKLQPQYAVYNGSLPEERRGMHDNDWQPEIPDRKTMRAKVPPLLLTNPSMLEYMMVRGTDQPMIEQSRGKLRWIVLDEAHTYNGSAANEMRLLIRRVLDAFGTDIDHVQFACTSATIGDPRHTDDLKRHMADLTGQKPERITIVGGTRQLPPITDDELRRAARRAGINDVPRLKQLRKDLISQPAIKLSTLFKRLRGNEKYEVSKALDLVDKLCEPAREGDKPMLALRAHFFMRTANGIYACGNANCKAANTPSFGHITTMPSAKCVCGNPFFELLECKVCNQVVLSGRENQSDHSFEPCTASSFEKDYFALDDEDILNLPTTADDDNAPASDSPTLLAPLSEQYHSPLSNANASELEIKNDDGKITLEPSENNAQHKWVELRGDNGNSCCPSCGKGYSRRRRIFNPFRVNREFYDTDLAPVLLSECASEGADWGKYLSFTDSRQGTARSAKGFNIEVERRQARIAAKELEASVSIAEFIDKAFNQELFSHIADAEDEKPAYRGALARNLLARRPVAGSSLESMGLITIDYPGLAVCQPPRELEGVCDAQQWRDFLKIVIDYFMRQGNHFQDMGDGENKFTRDTLYSTPVSAPGISIEKITQWPQVKVDNDGNIDRSQNRIVRLLCAGLGIDSPSKLQSEVARVNNILRSAWQQLTDNRILSVLADNDNAGCAYIDLSVANSRARIRKCDKAWICPISGQFVDTLFMGYTPTMAGGEISAELFAHYKVQTKAHTDLCTAQGSDNGWTARHATAFDYAPSIFLAAEHSAQQDRDLLREYTAEFTQDPPRLNVLQCSTTMEMGVDIGDIEIVKLATVPPTPANYMQRVGRAGRSGQSKALAFSICGDDTAGQATFSNPIQILMANTPVSQVQRSPVIEQRHVNSWLFRRFIAQSDIQMRVATRLGEFMGEPGAEAEGEGEGERAQVYDFIDFVERAATNAAMKDEFKRTFGDMSYSPDATKSKITSIRDEYHAQVKAINDAQEVVDPNSARFHALLSQYQRLAMQNLLLYLTEQQFLPNASMPTGIVEFTFMDQIRDRQIRQLHNDLHRFQEEKHHTRQPMRRREIDRKIQNVNDKLTRAYNSSQISREAQLALNEYAPGQTVVINERNYCVSGLTLRTDYQNYSQQRFVYFCPGCGKVEYLTEHDEHRSCPNCHVPYQKILDRGAEGLTRAYEAIGFTTDVNEPFTREERTQRKFYNIEPLLLRMDTNQQANSPFMTELYRSQPGAELLYYNAGVGYGFAICCACGRARVEDEIAKRDAPIPKQFVNHTHLYDRQRCMANNAQLYRNVLLTARHQTCYTVIAFKDSDGRYVTSKGTVLSLGVALTRALAQYLGIDADELAFGTRQERNRMLLYIYDTARGGCGYSLRMSDPDVCQQVMVNALQKLLMAPCNCQEGDTACSACLRDRTTAYIDNHLSKRAAIEWLQAQTQSVLPPTDPDVVAFSSGAKHVHGTLLQSLQRAIEQPTAKSLTLIINNLGEVSMGELRSRHTAIGRIIDSALAQGITVNVKLEYQLDPTYSAVDVMPIMGLADKFADCSTAYITDNHPFKTCAVVEFDNSVQRYFTPTAEAVNLSANGQWGQEIDARQTYVDAVTPGFEPRPEPQLPEKPETIFAGEYAPKIDDHFMVNRYFNQVVAPATNFDARAEEHLRARLSGRDVTVSLSDRYMTNPLSIMLAVSAVKELRQLADFNIVAVNLRVDSHQRSASFANRDFATRRPENRYLSSFFDSEEQADNFASAYIQKNLGVRPHFKAESPGHKRWLKIEASDFRFTLSPDHGFDGNWKSSALVGDIRPGAQLMFSPDRGRLDEGQTFYIVIDDDRG